MNSKEALNDLIDEIKHTHNNGKTLTEYDQKRTDIIAKDLELLEMLRPHLINAGIGMFDNVEDNEIFHLKLTFSGEEYNRIKEWLKNENK